MPENEEILKKLSQNEENLSFGFDLEKFKKYCSIISEDVLRYSDLSYKNKSDLEILF